MSHTNPTVDCRKTFEEWCFYYNGKRPVLDEHGGYGLGRNYDRWQAWQAAWNLQNARVKGAMA